MCSCAELNLNIELDIEDSAVFLNTQASMNALKQQKAFMPITCCVLFSAWKNGTFLAKTFA